MWSDGDGGSEFDDDDLIEGVKGLEAGATRRSGKLLVLQQILPLWHEQVGFAGPKLCWSK